MGSIRRLPSLQEEDTVTGAISRLTNKEKVSSRFTLLSVAGLRISYLNLSSNVDDSALSQAGHLALSGLHVSPTGALTVYQLGWRALISL